MLNPELNNALQQLQSELDNAQNMDEATRQKMVNLQSSIQRALDDPDQHQTLRDSLDEAGAQLEVEHPTLSAAISTVVNILSGMGI
jgi:CHASE3 domain sensor protein